MKARRFKIYFIDKDQSVSMVQTCKTKPVTDKRFKELIKEELLKTYGKYTTAFEVLK